MPVNLVHVGFGNFIAGHRIVDWEPVHSTSVQRVVKATKRESSGAVIDVTGGRRTRAVIFMDTGHIILTAIGPEAIASRVAATRRPSE